MNLMKTYVSAFLILAVLPTIILGATVWNSPRNTFSSTSPILINWTNSYQGPFTLNMTSGNSGQLIIGNATHTVARNYTQPDTGWEYYGGNPVASDCGLGSGRYRLLVRNNTIYSQTTRNLSGETEQMYLIKSASCPPGKYWGRINITNTTTDYATAEAILNIPVTSSLNATTGKARFAGSMRTSDRTYHSYYFNSSKIANSTSVAISLDKNIDVFLFDESGNYMAKNIEGTSGKLHYQYNPGDSWEIRLLDNTSTQTYAGYFMFSTLNITNSSNPLQQFSDIDFGQNNPGENSSVGVRIKNEGSLEQNSVSEAGEIYHLQEASGSGNTNHTFRAPDFSTKVYAEIRWNGTGNYSLNLYKPDGTFASNSSGRYLGANMSGVEQSVYANYSGAFGLSNDGMWIVEAMNDTVVNPSYKIIFKAYFSPGSWFDSDYNETDFNSTVTYSDYAFSLTVPEKTLGGVHIGHLAYTSSPGSVITLPVEVNVTTPELMVNGTFNSTTVYLNSIIGSNHTLILNITVNNTGNQDMTLSNSSSTYLNSSSGYMDFGYNAPVYIPPGNSVLLNITIDVNTSKTGNPSVNTAFTGWVYLNDSDASPYEGFNLTVTVNLKKDLTVRVTDLVTSDGDAIIEDPSSSSNITIHNKVFYPNGSSMTDLNVSNFGSVKLKSRNYSSYEYPVGDSNLNSSKGTLWQSTEYQLNFTLGGSSTIPGGYYDVYLTASRSVGGKTLYGTGSNGTLKIEGQGLYFSGETDLDDFEEPNEEQYYNITVTNYGTVAVDVVNISLSVEGDDGDECEDLLDIEKHETCSSDDISPAETCVIYWIIDSDDSDYIYDCVLDIETDIARVYNSPGSESISIDMSSSSDSSSSSSDSSDDVSEIDITEYPSSLSIVQGESKEFNVKVKNTGDTRENDIELSITGMDSSWYFYSPSNLDLASGSQGTFKVNITVPSYAEVKEYSLVFKADNGDVSDTKTSKLKVMPSEEEKERINESYGTYETNYTSLVARMRQMLLDGKNVTELNETIVQIKSKLDALLGMIDDEDYYNAAQVENEIKSLVAIAEALAGDEEAVADVLGLMGEAKNYIWLFVGVIVIVIAGFLIYMFMPAPKESHAVKKFKYVSPEVGESPGRKIKKELDKIMAKFRNRPKKEEEKKAGYTWKKK